MSWLLPWALGAAVAAAVGVTLLHLLARDRPPRWVLPTARFVAPGTARATRRARTPRDLILLAVRALALLLAGAAFAAPVLHPQGGKVAQVLVVDLGGGGAGAGAAIDTAQALYRDGDRLVVIDTAVRIVGTGAERAALDSIGIAARRGDSLDARSAGSAPGELAAEASRPTLTAAVIAAVRAAALLPPQADSAALVMIAPTLAPDAALARVRATWPGRVTVLDAAPVPGGRTAEPPVDVQQPAVRGDASDAVVAAARLAGARLIGAGATPGNAATSTTGATPRSTATLVIREAPTPADSAWAVAGGTLLVWPADTAAAGLQPMGQPDTVAGIVAGGEVALFRAARTHLPPAGTVVARWIDGEPAVTGRPHGSGCIRTAAIAVPVAGDVTLRPAFQAALRAMMVPCSRTVPQPIGDSTRALLAGDGPLARAGALRADSSRSPATPWLLGAALALLLLAEPLLRRPRIARTAGAAA